ncbi:hypothetical protein ACHAXR_003423 [Thalassiosira sp. AJA248-18]
MLRDLVAQARTGSTSAEQLEAVTAERDFFREKYAEQIDAMEELKGQLKESQRVIARLRSQVLDLELGKSSGVVGATSTPKQVESSGDSTNTSVTALTCDDDMTTKSGIGNNNNVEEPVNGEVTDGSVGDDGATPSSNVQAVEVRNSDAESHKEDDERSTTGEGSDDDEEEEESGSEDDEADKIRANAERMLLWANYQTSKRSTPNTSLIQDSEHDGGDDDESKAETESRRDTSSDAIVYSLPTSLDKRRSGLDDDSTLGSTSRYQPSVGSGSSRSGNKIGTIFNNLRDMIDPPSESDSDDESCYDD